MAPQSSCLGMVIATGDINYYSLSPSAHSNVNHKVRVAGSRTKKSTHVTINLWKIEERSYELLTIRVSLGFDRLNCTQIPLTFTRFLSCLSNISSSGPETPRILKLAHYFLQLLTHHWLSRSCKSNHGQPKIFIDN